MELLRYLLLECSLYNIFEVIPITVIAMVLTGWALHNNRALPAQRKVVITLFVSYCTALVNILCTPAYFWHTIWHSIWYGLPISQVGTLIANSLLSGSFQLAPTGLLHVFTSSSWTLFMLLANIALFVPFGSLYPLMKQNTNYPQTLAAAGLLGLLLELLQPVVGRSFDTSDLIAYALGCSIGYLMYKLTYLIYKMALRH